MKSSFDFGVEKQCQRCLNVYPTDLAEGPKWWYLKKRTRSLPTGEVDDDGVEVYAVVDVMVPGTYCKSCEKERVTQSRRVHRELRKLPNEQADVLLAHMGGDCACCGRRCVADERRLIVRGAHRDAVCLLCRQYAETAGWDGEIAREAWKSMFTHCALEQRLRNENRSDRPRPWHQRRAGEPQLAENLPARHVQCMWMERVWRNVSRWLETTAPERAGSHATSSDAP